MGACACGEAIRQGYADVHMIGTLRFVQGCYGISVLKFSNLAPFFNDRWKRLTHVGKYTVPQRRSFLDEEKLNDSSDDMDVEDPSFEIDDKQNNLSGDGDKIREAGASHTQMKKRMKNTARKDTLEQTYCQRPLHLPTQWNEMHNSPDISSSGYLCNEAFFYADYTGSGRYAR